MSLVAEYAKRYVARFGFYLTHSPPGTKGPRNAAWNDPANAIRTAEAADAYWLRNPNDGVGVLLEPSGLCSLDVDDVSITRDVLRAQGIELDAINAPRIVGNPSKFRLMFAAPCYRGNKADLAHRTLSWPHKDDPRKSFAVFELRAGLVSDQLPPSIHPGTGKPYRWAVPPRDGFPPLPPKLLALWEAWDVTEPEMKRLCPWYVPPPERKPAPRTALLDGPSVIEAFNRSHDAAQLLELHGYVKRGKRFASPGTSHAAGLALLDSGKVYCHHQGDPLATGRALDSFDLYVHLTHRGDMRAAVKAAAAELGLAR